MDYENLILTMAMGGEPLMDNPYRLGSEAWGAFVRAARILYNDGRLTDIQLGDFELLESNAGEMAVFEDRPVMLGVPLEDFDQTGWYFVYVINPHTGKVERLHFENEAFLPG